MPMYQMDCDVSWDLHRTEKGVYAKPGTPLVIPRFRQSSPEPKRRHGQCDYAVPADALILMSTPAGRAILLSASMVRPVGCNMSINRLCARISNCSRLFLSICGLRSTVYLDIRVGNGIGPCTAAPVRLAVSTISAAELSRIVWSYASIRMRILSCPGPAKSPVLSSPSLNRKPLQHNNLCRCASK